MRRFVKIINVPRVLCQIALGHNHSTAHRMIAGAALMCVGVGIAKGCTHWTYEWVHFTGDLAGYFFHGAGCAPFLEWLMEAEN